MFHTTGFQNLLLACLHMHGVNNGGRVSTVSVVKVSIIQSNIPAVTLVTINVLMESQK